jgi:hydrogenase expression/formation protein HypC
MCFAIPGKVLKAEGEWGEVDFLGQRRRINLKYVKAVAGDYVITAGNVAADVIPADKAEAIVRAFKKSRDSAEVKDG